MSTPTLTSTGGLLPWILLKRTSYDKQISAAFHVGETTIWRVRERFLENGLEEALTRRPQPERPEKRRLDGEAEAHLIALACSTPPAGYERWSVRLLTKQAIELEIVEQVGRETVRCVLKKCAQTVAKEAMVHSA